MNKEGFHIDWQTVFKIAIEATKGILCLHSWKPQIVHRDLKSLNLLVNIFLKKIKINNFLD